MPACAKFRPFLATASLKTTARYTRLTEVTGANANRRIAQLMQGFDLRREAV